MCCVCEESTLGLANTYWFPHQWDKAVRRAVREGLSTGVKHRVHRQLFSGGRWGWMIKRYKP